MKKVFALLVTSLIVLCALCGCGGTEYPSGSFYTMEEAYEIGWITKEDIMEACYRRFGYVVEVTDEDIDAPGVEVDYTSPYPDPVLDEQTEKAIIHAYYVKYNGQKYGHSESEDYSLDFYGEFQGSYILIIRCADVDYGDGITQVTLAGITWVESGPAFKVFRFDEE